MKHLIGLMLILALAQTKLAAEGIVPSAEGRGEKLEQQVAVTFAVIGDYGVDDTHEEAVARLVGGWRPGFVVTTGDNFYSPAIDAGDSGNPYHESTGKHYCGFLGDVAGAEPCANGDASANRFFPALGNHDWSDAGPRTWDTYTRYFTLPGAGVVNSNTSGNERYYDFVQGPVHFFVLNSNTNEPDGNARSAAAGMASRMGRWLRSGLAASTSPWNVVVCHHPPYSSGLYHGSSPWMQWDFAGWGADVVLSGHEHDYERIASDGIVYFVNGLGGGARYRFGLPVRGSQARYHANWGAMRVTATAADMDFEFVSVDGVVRDAYHLTKDSDGETGRRSCSDTSAHMTIDQWRQCWRWWLLDARTPQ